MEAERAREHGVKVMAARKQGVGVTASDDLVLYKCSVWRSSKIRFTCYRHSLHSCHLESYGL